VESIIWVKGRVRSPLPWLGGLLGLYLLAPVVAFVVRLTGGVSSTPGVGSALLTSLETASISAALIALLGTPLAYLLARGHGFGSRLLTALVALPIALPPLMSGLLLLYVVGPYTTVGRLFGGGLTETNTGIVLAQTFVAAPFLVIAARAAFAGVDPALEDVAATLGHGPFARFWRVAVPAALPGIGAGLLLAWLRAFGEFGATVILAYHPYSLPVFTFVQFDSTGLPATMLPIAVALAAALAILLVAGGRPPRRRGRLPASYPQAPSADPPEALAFSLQKRLGDFSLSLTHPAGSPRLALLGPSGAGKTLTLKLIAGLARPASDSHVHVGSGELHTLPTEGRGIGYVPQQPALQPRRTVWRQVMLGAGANPALPAWWIERLGLAGLEDRYPEELSGGQQRRVALARALSSEPRILLLDEPFTGLDAPVRDSLRRELRVLQREAAISTVIVTHDPEEAALLADELIVLEEGRVLQAGSREEVFGSPASPRVAALLGIANAHRGRVVSVGRIACEGVELEAATNAIEVGSEIAWSVRPERISLQADGRYCATLIDEIDLGSVRELSVCVDGGPTLTVRTLHRHRLEIGESVGLEMKPVDVNVWPLGDVAVAER
jgi:ABC-type Fe3+/spermidine/putrescine transport system ATPase subunit/ABC-type sulfate transport system permease component